MKNDKFLKILEERSIVSPDNYQYLEKRTFKKGDYLLDQGEDLHYAYIIVEGKVQTLHTNSNGATLLNGISHVGEVIGMVEFMNGLPVSHDAIAMSKCIVLCINVKTTRDIFMHDLMFMTYIARHLALITYYSGNNAAISLHKKKAIRPMHGREWLDRGTERIQTAAICAVSFCSTPFANWITI